jgi:nucleotide-binding universal stress UspA family protein
MTDKILIAVDGSKYSRKALEFACKMANKFDGELHIVHVPQGIAADRVMVLGGASIMIHATREQLEAAGRQLVEAAARIAADAGCANAITELRGGDPATEILASADEYEADYIVIGSRGLGDFGGMLLGSVSHKVNQSASKTCITVH